MMITIEDIKCPDSSYELSLSKLFGKEVADVRGYLSGEFGEVSFKLTSIHFKDGSMVDVEGEHDHPYITEYRSCPQPNFDEETMERLYEEQNL